MKLALMLSAVVGMMVEDFDRDHASAVETRCKETGLGFADGGASIVAKWDGATLADVFSEYEKINPAGFRGTTRPFKSTQTFTGIVVVNLGAPVMSHAVFRAGQAVDWFSYGIGDQIQRGGGLTKIASAADTNLSRGKRTNGVTDFVIQGISSSCNGVRIQYAAADVPAAANGDADVQGAYLGTRKVYDPGSLIVPPTFSSPLNLEEVLFNAIAPQIEFTMQWDRGRIIPIGTIDQVPEGGGKSLLRANGLPSTENRYKSLEGYPWRRTDKPDGDFTIQGTLRDAVVIPFPLIAFAAAAAPLVVPVNVMVDMTVRVHGVGLEQIGQV